MSKNHSKCGDKIGYGRFKLRLPVLRLGFWPWAFHSRSGMTRAFIWHQKVKIANLQLSNVMLKDRVILEQFDKFFCYAENSEFLAMLGGNH